MGFYKGWIIFAHWNVSPSKNQIYTHTHTHLYISLSFILSNYICPKDAINKNKFGVKKYIVNLDQTQVDQGWGTKTRCFSETTSLKITRRKKNMFPHVYFWVLAWIRTYSDILCTPSIHQQKIHNSCTCPFSFLLKEKWKGQADNFLLETGQLQSKPQCVCAIY